MRQSQPRRSAVLGLPVALIVLIACGSTQADCEPVPFASGVDAEYREQLNRLDFEPPRPCSSRSDLEVTRVLGSTAPAGQPEPRISFIVERRGTRAYTLSATRAELPFRAIPMNTRPLRVTRSDVTAAGFAGQATTGDQIAYLRWRIDGVTYELAADLHPWLTATNVESIASALIDRSSPGSATPTSTGSAPA